MDQAKETLMRYLQTQRDALLWKLAGLGELDMRRPLVPSATNLLGLIKHMAGVEYGYFGETFGRPSPEPMPWEGVPEDQLETNYDMWATAGESSAWIVDFYRRAQAHANATIEELDLDDIGAVPWWPEERRQVPLHLVITHVIAETARHAGHADIVRELIDGEIGLREGNTNIPTEADSWWKEYRERVQSAADEAGGNAG